MLADTLLCPGCYRAYPSSERFCAKCGLPLIYSTAAREAEQHPSPLRERARKIKPQYAEGKLVKVGFAENQTEAEFIQGLLLEEGIPSMLRNSIAGYAPVVGTCEVLVPESGAEAAREALSWREPVSPV